VISRLADFVEDEDLNVNTLFHDELSRCRLEIPGEWASRTAEG